MPLQGPSGSYSQGDAVFSDNLPQGAVITSIAVSQGSYINGIVLGYQLNGGSYVSAHGADNSLQWFDLNPGEFITGFSGNYGDVVNQLVIYTNQRCSPLYGSSAGPANFCYMVPDGYVFAGFWGRVGSEISALGYIANPQTPTGGPTALTAARMGPCGDPGDNEWLEVAAPGAQIQTINVWSTSTDICGIQVVYQSSATLPAPQAYGTQPSTPASITLNAGEYITGISGTAGGTGTGNLNTLTITTNGPRTVNFGATAGHMPFNLAAAPGSQVVGLMIRSGDKIDALGIYTAPAGATTPVFEPVWSSLYVTRTAAAAVFGEYLYAIVPPSPPVPMLSGPLQIANVNLASLNPDGTLPLPTPAGSSLWQTTCNLSLNTQYTQLGTWAGISAAVLGECLCVFWQDANGLAFTQLGADLDLTKPTARKPWAACRTSKATIFPGRTRRMSARSHSTAPTCWWRPSSLERLRRPLRAGRFSGASANVERGGNLEGAQLMDFTLAQLQAVQPSLPSCGNTLAIEWYAVSGEQCWFAMTLWDSSANNAFLFWLPLDLVSMPYMYLGDTPDSPIVNITGYTIPNVSSPVALRKDPAGRIRMYATGPQSLLVYTQPGNTAPSPVTMDWLPLTGPSNRPFAPRYLAAPVPVFNASPASVLTTVVNDPDNLPNQTNPAYPVAETIFVPDWSDQQWECLTRPIGRLQQVPNLIGTPQPQSIITIKGIADGPIPIPNENTVPYTFPGGFPNSCGDIIYGTSLEGTEVQSFSCGMTFGIQSQGESTKGVGPCWDIAVSAGAGSSSVNTTTTQLMKNVAQASGLNSDQSVQTSGTLFATGINFNTTLYRFLVPVQDGSGNYEVANDAYTCIATAATLVGENNQKFVPYDVTPGDLTTYTSEAWNRTMKSLGYPGSNYFDDVIKANAYQFAPNVSYLEFDWTVNSWSYPKFQATDSALKEFSWTFDSSVYMGISYGEDVDFLGMGFDTQAEYMAGVTINLSGNTQTETENQWGITPKSLFCPPPTTGKPGYQSYTWRLYFLPASPQWWRNCWPTRPMRVSRLWWIRTRNPGELSMKWPRTSMWMPAATRPITRPPTRRTFPAPTKFRKSIPMAAGTWWAPMTTMATRCGTKATPFSTPFRS